MPGLIVPRCEPIPRRLAASLVMAFSTTDFEKLSDHETGKSEEVKSAEGSG